MKNLFSVLISNFILVITFANKALAQTEFGVNDLGDAGIALGTRSIQDTIAGIINIFLGFLGILATLLILYAGFLWMTSRGNAEKIERAKLLIASAVIGLVIIVSAYAISRFILGRLYDVTGPGGPGGPGGGGGGSLPTCSEPANLDDPLICSLSNSIGPVGRGLTIRGWHFDTDGDLSPGVGRVEIGGVPAEIVECNGSPMWGDKKVKVKIPETLVVGGTYQVVLYNDLLPNGLSSIENPHFDFTVSAGTSAVNIDCLVPDEVTGTALQATAPPNPPQNVQILGNGFTNTGVLSMNGWDAINGSEITLTDTTGLNIIDWSDLEINVSVPVNALASDIIVDVGGNQDQEFFDITCTFGTDCLSGCCSSLSCVSDTICNGTTIVPGANAPVIQSISPENGEDGTLVTIFGYNFGDSANPGTVSIGGDIALAPICGSTWHDDYIVVEVPSGTNGLLDIIVTQAAAVGGESSDLYQWFDRNDIVRPGICALSTINGVYRDNLGIDGINFTAGDTAYFDTVASYQTTVVDINNISTEVPNVVGTLGVIVQSTASVDSNTLPFTALADTSGLPVITEITPDNGPVDAYITIRGSNFGNTQGIVRFDSSNRNVTGAFDFPSVCGNTWSDNEIIVKVPDAPISLPWTLGATYSVEVIRASDGLDSNDYDFVINSNLLGPQICAISPDNGPVGTPVIISGENFGPQTGGEVVFYDNISASTIVSWSANQIYNVDVPVGVSTGSLILRDTDGNDSNPILFDVGSCTSDIQCGGGELCCSGVVGNSCLVTLNCDDVLNSSSYSWDITTQAEPFGLYYGYSCSNGLQSPSPWPDEHQYLDDWGVPVSGASLDAFVDANIVALFTRDVKDTDFVINDTPADNIQLWQCNTSGIFDQTTCNTQIFDNDGILEILNSNSNREGFSFNPASPLLADTWYEVRLGTFNAEIGNDTWTPDPFNDSWHFKTRTSDSLCEVSSVAVTPQNPQANLYPGRTKNFSASPLADNCNICGGDYTWQWSLGPDPTPIPPYVPPGAYASILSPLINSSVNKGSATLEGGPAPTENVTNPNYVTLIAENTNYSMIGESYPIILAPVLRVENNIPACDDSCLNVAVWVDFNTALTTPLNAADFSIYECLDSACIGWDLTTDYVSGVSGTTLANGVYRVDLTTNPSLPANENYKVIVDSNITNIYGYTLGSDYTWDFGVSDNNCMITGADIYPDTHIAYSTNDVTYKGYAIADTGACGAQAITCDTCNWTWSTDNASMVTIDPGGIGIQTVQATPGNTAGVTNINLDISDASLGTASESASFENAVGGTVIPGSTTLTIDNYWPNCNGACSNSEIKIDFSSAILESSLVGHYEVLDTTSGTNITNSYTLTNSSKTLILDTTTNLVLGNSYQVTVRAGILPISGDALQADLVYPFTIGQADCQVTSAEVLPVYTTAEASEAINYNVETIANTISCGNLPVYCDTCSYGWTDSPDLGAFSFPNVSHQSTVFTTFDTVVNGDTTQVAVDVVDQGATFSSNGILDIAMVSVVPSSVILTGYEPLGSPINMCTNLVPFAEFNITNGNLDRQSLIDHAIFYQNVTNSPFIEVPFSIRFVESVPGVTLTAMYEPSSLLDINTFFFVGFDDVNQILTEDGDPISIGVPPLDIALNGDEGWYFVTGFDACTVHSVEILPQEDLFSCIEDTCEGDDPAGGSGNQHNYQSISRDIQSNILNPNLMTYNWVSGDNTIVDPVLLATPASILGTAGVNGMTYLGVEVIDADNNLVTDSANVEVATCQEPWPALNNYPWEDTLGDMNFSTYYCEEYGVLGETVLPSIKMPGLVTSPNTNVLREYVTTISYPVALNDSNSYLGSLAYYEEDNKFKSWTEKLSSLFRVEKTNGQVASTLDIIAFRIMRNPKHLSVADWYMEEFQEQAGSLMQVDGYEALRVGGSIYIAATNIEAGTIYTNIYIIAHNIGANETTLDIYNQMVDNFKLNTNIDPLDNTCNGQSTLSCSSDFDCPNYCTNPNYDNQVDCIVAPATWLPDTCNSQGLKLRRDTKRLSDLVGINNAILAYGLNHKACENNSLISCENNTDCPGSAACVAYYPPLNAGSYLNGASNSLWPSWQDALSNTLSNSLPEDPINLFNGCELEIAATGSYNTDTCWNEESLEFLCPANSLVYMYDIAGVGQNYNLRAKFEYDMSSTAETFFANLDNPVNSLDLNNSACNAIVIDAPGATTNPYCGNGIIDTDYCSDSSYDNSSDCGLAGAIWISTEECDSQFHHFACSESPVGASPAIATVPPANTEWWNEQTIGCNPPGALDSNNNLIECTWYRPTTPLTPEQCGGYCGDNILQPYYESCDGGLPNNDYHCLEAGVNPYCGACQVLCDNGTDIYPAAICGDGVWSEGIEQCDPSANIDGTMGWDCTEGGSIACSNTCERICTTGDAYEGICGDGIVVSDINPNTNEAYEACDYANYYPVLPADSGATTASYACTSSCEMNDQYCGDGVLQYQYQELCDYGNNAYTAPIPLFSDEYNQYGCRDATTYTCSIDGLSCIFGDDSTCDQSGDPQTCLNVYLALNGIEYGACTATLDGYCGDGHIQDGNTFPNYNEVCDPGSPWDGIPQSFPVGWPAAGSDENFQYLCDVDCVGTVGGWCGDGKADDPYELCDGSDYPARPIPANSDITHTYTCSSNCNDSAVTDGGWCGDSIVNELYYEGCDDASFSVPWPLGTSIDDLSSNFSRQNNQYLCSSCVNFGGWCGNGIIDGFCTSALCADWQCNVDGSFDLSINSESECLAINNPPATTATWLPTTSVGCSEFECTQQGGTFAAYEQCDTGFSPNSIIDKNVDIVYIFDTSGGMSNAAADLCQSTATVANTLKQDHPEIDFRITIFPLGDGDSSDGGAELTSISTDNIQQFFVDGGIWSAVNPITNASWDTDVTYDGVFNALYTDCTQLVNSVTGESVYPEVRYLSLYDDATNDINGIVSVTAGDGPVNQSCAPYDATENWGYVMKRVIEDYNWLPGYSRIVVPVSNEYAVCGSGTWEDLNNDGIDDDGDYGLLPNEDFDNTDGIYDILEDAVASAIANTNDPVYINPVLLLGYNAVGLNDIGQRLADATRGSYTNSTTGWETQTIQVINSTFCDAAGGSNPNLPFGGPDGSMDCRADGNWVPNQPPASLPAPPTITNLVLTTSVTAGDPFIYNVMVSPDAQTVPTFFYQTGLPAGLSINSSTGVISGSTTELGVHSIDIWATNAGGMNEQQGMITLSLTVNQQLPTITSALTATVQVNTPSFTYNITADNNPSSFIASGSIPASPLPSNLSVDTITGVISGTPTVAGIYNILISATNAAGTGTAATLVLTVTNPPPPAPVIISTPSTSVLDGSNYSYTIFTLPTATSYTASNLPPNFSLISNVVSGVAAVGTYNNITVNAINAGGTATQSFNLIVDPCSTLGKSCGAILCCGGLTCTAGSCVNLPINQN